MKVLFSIMFVLVGLGVTAQSYTVTYLKGNIYCRQKPLKMHDKVEGTDLLTSNDQSAELGLFNLQKGRVRLTFVNSKPVQAKQTSEESAIYKLIVSDNIQKYTTEKMLTTRGDFDLKIYLKHIDANDVLLVENERLPLTSHFMRIDPADHFFICQVGSKDTSCKQIHVAGRELAIDTSVFNNASSGTLIPCIIKFGSMRDGTYSETEMARDVNVTFLSKADLLVILDIFKEGWDTYYQRDKQKFLTDVELQLSYNYGDYYKPAVEQVLTELLDK